MHTILTPILLWTLSWAAIDNPYFPIKKKPGDAGLTQFEAEWYGKSLEQMNEPRLQDVAKDATAEVYRIMILPTWGNSIVVRAQKRGDVYRLSARRLDGQAGYDPGKLVESRDVELSVEDSRKLDGLIQSVNFFEMPTETDIRGCDGDEWILEGVSRGSYHVVQRWSATHYKPEKRKLKEFLSLFRFLLAKSKLSQKPTNKGYPII